MVLQNIISLLNLVQGICIETPKNGKMEHCINSIRLIFKYNKKGYTKQKSKNIQYKSLRIETFNHIKAISSFQYKSQDCFLRKSPSRSPPPARSSYPLLVVSLPLLRKYSFMGGAANSLELAWPADPGREHHHRLQGE